MSTYRVKIGYSFGGMALLPEGSIIEMDEREALGFLDKLELVEGGDAPGETLTASVPQAPVTESAPDKAGKRKG